MKLLLCFLLAITSLTATPSERTLHLFVSPWTAMAVRERQHQQLRSFLLREAPAGLRVQLWNGWTGERMADAHIPHLRYDNAAARVQNRDLARFFGALKQWAEADESANELSGSGALRPMELLRELDRDVNVASAVVLLGSPLYRSLTEPAFSMNEGRYPSDGHLKCTVIESVYGVAGLGTTLGGITLHWAIPDPGVWQSELYREAVTRFWVLYVHSRGGTLASVGSDLPRLLQLTLQSGLRPVVAATPDAKDDKPLMRSALPRTLPAWLQVTPPSHVKPTTPVIEQPAEPTVDVVEPDTRPSLSPLVLSPAPSSSTVTLAPISPTSPASAPLAPAPNVPAAAILLPVPPAFDGTKSGVGIAWAHHGVDVDIYAKVHARAKEISYQRDRTAEGRLYKDEQNANAGRYFEFVEFNDNIDLSTLTLWVNFYAGRGPISGQVVFFDHGRIKVGSFSIAADRGNGGRSTAQRASSPHWVQIKISDLAEVTEPLVAQRPR